MMTPPSSTITPEAHESDPLLTSSFAADGDPEKQLEDITNDNTNDDNDDEHNNTSILDAMTEVLEHAVETVEHVVHDATDELHTVADSCAAQLHDADEGELTFLDMTLTRGLSILPGELQKVTELLLLHEQEHPAAAAEETQTLLELTHQATEKTTEPDAVSGKTSDVQAAQAELGMAHQTPPWSAYLGLASAVVSLSAIGPLLAVQRDATGLLKIVWRMLGTSVLLLPLAITDLKRDGFPVLTAPQWTTFVLSTGSYLILVCAFVLSIERTAIGNAVILSNSQAIMLLVGNLFVGNPVNWLEGGGAVMAFLGAVLCSKDSMDAVDTDANSRDAWSSLQGDALALLAGAGGCGYLIFAPSVRQHMALFLFTFSTMFAGTVLCLAFQILVVGETVTLDRNVNTGLFGFLSLEPDRLPLELVIVIICNCGGTLGYIRAMQFFGPLIISVAGLMEPVTAEILSFGFGVSLLPGWMGWLGNLLVACGTLAVVWPTDNKKPVGH